MLEELKEETDLSQDKLIKELLKTQNIGALESRPQVFKILYDGDCAL